MTQTSEQQRPLMTFALVCYNQEAFITEAVQGAFDQTYSPLEIILSDDCSKDGTFDKLQALAAEYHGPHQVVVRQNASNMGLAAHINAVMSIAKSELVIIAAGDDVSLPNRAERIYEAYEASGRKARSIYSDVRITDSNGQVLMERLFPQSQEKLTLEIIASGAVTVLGASQAWHRSVFDFFGPMNESVIREDAVIPFRAALSGTVVYIDEPLVLYRRSNTTLFAHRNTVKDLYRFLGKLLPSDEAVYENRLEDLQTVYEVYPEKKASLSVIENITQNRLESVQTEWRLLKANRLKRLYIIIRAGLHGTSFRRLSRWVMMYLFPRVYLLYRWIRNPLVRE